MPAEDCSEGPSTKLRAWGASPSVGLMITLRKEESSGLNACAPYAAAPTALAPVHSPRHALKTPDSGSKLGLLRPAPHSRCGEDGVREPALVRKTELVMRAKRSTCRLVLFVGTHSGAGAAVGSEPETA